MKQRIPAFVCATGSWLTAVCLVLPYPVYTTYLDVGVSLSSSLNISLCVIQVSQNSNIPTFCIF
ncbi:hypothetical protein O3M35_006930 [Rhynocoris fuscipes]|uniref:Uncharacterized protein n=1 Tax=Rhynocoris fuscipes TaxID=488301 RepID=A0AAW1DL60_9HEMI